MKSVGSYMLVFLMAIFWAFRVIVAFTASLGIEMGFVPYNQNFEIILLFVTLLCIILVVKRKLLGAIIYLACYGIYFGLDMYNLLLPIINGAENVEISQYSSIFIAFIGIVIPVCVLFELLFDRNRKNHPSDKKTDWFYNNEEYDRKMDERADKNNYRTL